MRTPYPRHHYLAFAFLLGLIAVTFVLALTAPKAVATPIARQTQASPTVTTEPLPQGAIVQTILPGMNQPVAMAFDPQGRLFYTERSGAVRLFTNDLLQASPVITFPNIYQGTTCIESRLLGITVDPNFNTNHYVYVFYTEPSECRVALNRVVRFVESNGVGSNPIDIFTSPQTEQVHQGGIINFGPDGKLYISLGDNYTWENAQNVTVKPGKIHRLNPDGTIPPDNPVFTQTGALPSLYAIGFRNPFGFAFDTIVPGRIFASENGPECDDELNRVEGGYNYGWRANYPCDDANPDPTYNTIPPLWYAPNPIAPTGVEVYRGSAIGAWRDGLFMCSYNDGALRRFYLNEDRTQVTTVATIQGVTCKMDVETGPDGALYYIEDGGYTTGTLKRIVATSLPTCDNLAGNIVSSPNTASSSNTFRGAAAVTANDVWAVGWHSGPAPARTLIEHWNGQGWDIMSTPNVGTRDNYLFAVAGTSDSNAWAAGHYKDPTDPTGTRFLTLTMHWNGTQWSIMPSPNINTTGELGNFLRGIDVISGSDAWAVGYSGTEHAGIGQPLTMHWNGTQWNIIPSPTFRPSSDARMLAVEAISSNDVWAVGNYTPDSFLPEETLIMHWDGTAWTQIPSPNVGSDVNLLRGVTAISSNDVWAVGFYGPRGTGQTLVLHWNGTEWSVVPSPNAGTFSFLLGVDAVAANDIWAVGNYYTGGIPRTLVEHWNGSEWRVVPSLNPTVYSNYLYGVAAATGYDIWMAGEYDNQDTTKFTLTERFTPATPYTFSDVPSDNTFYPFIHCLVCRGIISGYADGTFRPNNEVTRGQLSKIVSNSAGFAEDPGEQRFEDVPPTYTFYEWIQRLAARGHMGGYECGGPNEPCISGKPYFRPNANATRGQISKIVSNARGYNNPPGAQIFEDVPPTYPFYEWVQRLASRNIMSGYPCGGPNEPCISGKPYFRPQNNATRGQTSKIVANTFFPECQQTSIPSR